MSKKINNPQPRIGNGFRLDLRPFFHLLLRGLRGAVNPPLHSLKAKLVLLFGLLFLAVIFIVSMVSFSHQRRFLLSELEHQETLLAQNLAITSREAVLGRDELTLHTLFAAVEREPDIAYAFIADHRGKIVMHTNINRIGGRQKGPIWWDRKKPTSVRQLENGAADVEVAAPIRYGRSTIGTAVIGFKPDRVDALIAAGRRRAMATMFFGLLLGIGGMFGFVRLFLRPLSEIVGATREVGRGNLEVIVPIRTQDELGELADAFNSMTGSLQKAYRDIERGSWEMTRALAAAVEAKDLYTRGHCERVVKYATMIGRRLGLSRQELRDLELAATLHDIGKIGVKDRVLMKRSPLSFSEMRAMHNHPDIGARILSTITGLSGVAQYVLCHHESVNGKGYPHGLKGNAIPLISRIIMVADSYDAMSTNRPYRTALPPEEVHRRLLHSRGRQFDPQVLDAFLEVREAGLLAQDSPQAATG